MQEKITPRPVEFTEGIGSDTQWQTLARPGYFGKRKAEILADYEQEFGKDNWRLAWIVQESVFDLEHILMLYEDGYYHYLKQRTDLLETLVAEAADVYDDAPSNVQCGLDYAAQESHINHFQDIALRRVVARLGRRFEGSQIIQIRHTLGTHALSVPLSPGAVPFHHPEWILQPELSSYWWGPGSVESFYQSNKILQVRRK